MSTTNKKYTDIGEPEDKATFLGSKDMLNNIQNGKSYSGNDLLNGTGYDVGGSLLTQSQANELDKKTGESNTASNSSIPEFTYAAAPTFNYSGGGYTPFTYASAPTYTSKYQDQINSMVDALLNKDAFSYDVNSDPLYKQYSDQYTRLGKQAMVDTLGQVSARTGGLASSYAGTASQQAYNSYMQQLSDKVPELYQLAYSMYNDQDTKERNNIALIQALEDGDYNRYLDILSQYNTDRNLAYSQHQDQISQANTDRNFAYKLYQDQLSQYNTDKEYAYNKYLQDNGLSSDSNPLSSDDLYYMSVINSDTADDTAKALARNRLGLKESELSLTSSKDAQHQEDIKQIQQDIAVTVSTQGKNRGYQILHDYYSNGYLNDDEYSYYVNKIKNS